MNIYFINVFFIFRNKTSLKWFKQKTGKLIDKIRVFGLEKLNGDQIEQADFSSKHCEIN